MEQGKRILERSAEVEALTVRLYQSLATADADLLVGLLSERAEPVFIGTDPDEWWVGSSTVPNAIRELLASTGGLHLEGGNPHAFREGNVAWLHDCPHFVLPNGTAIPVRLTASALLEGVDWRFVQIHLSVGISNDVPPEVIAVTSSHKPQITGLSADPTR